MTLPIQGDLFPIKVRVPEPGQGLDHPAVFGVHCSSGPHSTVEA